MIMKRFVSIVAKKQKYGKNHKYKMGKFVNFGPNLLSNGKRGKLWKDNRFESEYTRRNDKSKII
jgi:hypothetical protein